MNWLPKSNVLVPVDLSPSCLYALETALQLVKQPSDIYALHVQVPMDIASPAIPWAVEANVDYPQKARESMEAFMSRVSKSGVQSLVRFGRPGPVIAEFVKEHNIELIVMPSHGRSGMQRFLMGSVTDRVLRTVACPVLVLRHDPDERNN